MEESVAVGHEFYECSEVHDVAYGAVVCLAFFGEFDDGVDHFECFVDTCLVGGLR